jgi:hypothetical protein
LGSVTVGRFPDGEVSISVHENGERNEQCACGDCERCPCVPPGASHEPTNPAPPPLPHTRLATQSVARTFTSSSLRAHRT